MRTFTLFTHASLHTHTRTHSENAMAKTDMCVYMCISVSISCSTRLQKKKAAFSRIKGKAIRPPDPNWFPPSPSVKAFQCPIYGLAPNPFVRSSA